MKCFSFDFIHISLLVRQLLLMCLHMFNSYKFCRTCSYRLLASLDFSSFNDQWIKTPWISQVVCRKTVEYSPLNSQARLFLGFNWINLPQPVLKPACCSISLPTLHITSCNPFHGLFSNVNKRIRWSVPCLLYWTETTQILDSCQLLCTIFFSCILSET